MSFFKNISHDHFLSHHWEKHYLFLPKSFDDPTLSLNFSEILDLCLDEEVESRLITQSINNDWDVEYGPFENADFDKNHKKWTLFIHNFNLLERFSFELQKLVQFIPSWLFDDVLCSISSDGSSVGAHFDRYNVFILQISGQRKWKIQQTPDKRFRDDCSIKVLENFEPDSEHTLGPGDMIFIPPGCAHEGTSIGESISLSIGFKSLEDAALLESFFTEALLKTDKTSFFPTDQTHFSNESCEIKEDFIATLQKRVLKQLENPENFKDAAMKFFTETKSEQYIENEQLKLEQFTEKLKNTKWFFKDEIRYTKMKDEFWINQVVLKLDKNLEKELRELIDNRFLDRDIRPSEALAPILFHLYIKEILYFECL